MGSTAKSEVRVVGRYALYGAIAAGGMATVHLGRLLGPVGFSRTVAIKRLHAQFASDPEFVSMFLDEARLAARIRHPNVVPTLDVVATGGELFLVMDYVPGESVSRLSRALREKNTSIPLRHLSSIIAGVLHGLHAAHEAKDERGHPLGIVHRDVSPQNVLVGTDGVARVLDFGVAKAAGRVQTTREGQIKGKLSYMPPEQLRGATVSRQTDIYAAGVMLWELVTGQRLFAGDNEGAIVGKILEGRVEAPSRVVQKTRGGSLAEGVLQTLETLDSTILRALNMKPEDRFTTAREMAVEIERKCPPSTASDVADWVELVARDVLHSRAALIAEIESSASMQLDLNESNVMNLIQAKETLGLGAETPALSPAAPPPGPQAHPGAHAHAYPHASPASNPQGGPGYGPRPASGFYFDGPPVTQPSSISVSSQHRRFEEAQSGRRALLAVITGVLLGTGALGAALIYRALHRPPVAAAPLVASASSAAGADTAIVEPLPSAVPAAAPSGSASAEPSSAPSASTAQGTKPPTPTTTTATTKPTGQKTGPVVKPAGGGAGSTDCNPPYWFDAQNVKHYYPQCLTR